MKPLPQAGNNSFVSNSFFIFLIRFFPSLANVLVIIFFSHRLDKPTYAIYQDFWVQLFILSTIACLGFQSFIITYQPPMVVKFIRQFKYSYYIAFFAWVFVVSIVFAFFQQQAFGFIIPFAFLLVYALSVITESLLIAFRNFTVSATINILYTLIFCWLHWMFVTQHWSFTELFTWLLCISAAKLLVSLLVLIKDINEHPAYNEAYDKVRIRKLWLHMGIYDVLQTVFRWLDKFIVALMLSKELFAIYFNGSLEVPFLPLLLGAAGSAALMQLSIPKSDTGAFTVQLLNRSGKLLSSVVFPLFLFFLVFRRELFEVVLSAQYLPAVPVFLVSVLSMPLKAYSFTTVLQNRHKGNIINIGAVLDMIIALALVYPLYQQLGLPGVALAFVISSYIQAAFYLHHTSRELSVPVTSLIPISNWLLKLIVFASLFIGFHYLLSGNFTNKINLFLGCGLVMLTVFIALLLQLRSEKSRYGAATQK